MKLSLLQLTCTLKLKLFLIQIRVHCFFYLLPVTLKGEFAPAVDSQVADAEVTQLNRDLFDIYAALSSALTPVKCKVSDRTFNCRRSNHLLQIYMLTCGP